MTEATRRTPLYDEHKALGARLVPFAGYEMPIQYAGISSEHEAVRKRAGLFDVSHMGELELSGEHSAAVVDYLVTNDLERIEVGRAMYTCCCGEAGTILDDLIVYKRGIDDILVVCNASNRDKIAAHFRKAAENHCEFRDVSDTLALLALQGPAALDVLAKMGAGQASDLKPFRFAQLALAGADVMLARTGYTGEDGAEIFVAADKAAELWRAIMAAGKDAGVAAAGLGARDTLRLEARLSLYGNDIDETTNPLEAGLGWTVKFDASDFVGKQALSQIKERGLSRKIVGFEMVGRGIARHGYPLLSSSGESVGTCTSGSPSPTLGKNIGLGYLPLEMTEVGSQFQVDCRGKRVDAVVVKTPFYKRPK